MVGGVGSEFPAVRAALVEALFRIDDRLGDVLEIWDSS